ncbi:hypothetical protein AGMMS49992_19300 [Clostridia bacterium]|nr:hypothetical protein AGMMS49992_19300 [Clostridia bacterium]
MKSGMTIQELASELARQQGTKRDFIVNTRSLSFSPDADRLEFMPNSGEGTPSHTFGMTDLFQRQLADAVSIPTKYYDRLRREDERELLSLNVNRLLFKREAKQTVRTLDGVARAFLSDRYRRIDNDQVTATILPILNQIPDARVESCEITSARMYIKIVNPRLESEVRKGDVVQAGVIVSNSEIGLGSLSVMPLVYRLVCKNGLIVNDLGHRKYHFGREQEECWDLYGDDTRRADDDAFLMKVADVVKIAADEARFGMVVDKLRDAADTKITAPIDDVIELTAERFSFNKTETSGILQHLIEGGDLTMYGLSNAVTRTSQDVDDYDRATELERVGWQIITQGPKLLSEVK